MNRPNPAKGTTDNATRRRLDLDATDAGVSEPPWTSPCDPIRNKSNGGAMKVLAADSDTLDGWLGTLALVDELGRWPSGENYGLLRASVVPRNGQIIGISTASDDEANPLGKLRAQAMKVPTFRRDPENPKHKIATSKSFAMHESSLDPGDDYTDITTIKLVNPASWMTEELLQEELDSPSFTPWAHQRFRCGLW